MKDCSKKSDAEVVKLAIKDDQYFAVLVERYENKLMRYILRITQFDLECAEDVLQEVFIKVYKNLNGYDTDFNFSSWVYRIAHNEVIDQVRKLKARPRVMQIDNGEVKDYVEILPDDLDLNEDLKGKELARTVREALFSLPQKYRDVLVLRYLEDKSYLEISDILKRSVNSVSVLINRAKDKLRGEIKSFNI